MTLRDQACNLRCAIQSLSASDQQTRASAMALELIERIGHFEELHEAMSNALHEMANECTCKLAEAHRETIDAQKKAGENGPV